MVNFEPPEEKRGESKKLSVEAKKVVQKTANLLQSAKKIKADKLGEAIKKVRMAEITKITKSFKASKIDKLTEAIKNFSIKQKNLNFEKKNKIPKSRPSKNNDFRISKLTNASTRALMIRLIARKVNFDIDDGDDFRINKSHETKAARKKSKTTHKNPSNLTKKQREELKRTKAFVTRYGQFMTWFGLITTAMSLILIIRAVATTISLSMAGNSPETLQGMDVFGIATYGLIILPYAVFNFLFSIDYMLYGNKMRQLLLPASRMRHVTSSTMILLILQIVLSGVLIWLGLYDYVPVFMWLSIFQAGFVFYTLYYKIKHQKNYKKILK